MQAAEPEQAQPGRQVGEQVHVTVGAVLAAGHAAEYPQVADSVGCRSGDQVVPAAADAAAHRPGQSAQAAGWPPQAQRQLEASRVDQRASAGMDGCRCLDSYALITLCVTPARAARSTWDRPARLRAWRSRAPAVAGSMP